MAVLQSNDISIKIFGSSVLEKKDFSGGPIDCPPEESRPSYFDLLDELPEFSEAAILLEDNVIEYCYVRNGADGKQYFGFDRCLPQDDQYNEIIARHKLVNKMEANTFEKYPSGKTILSRRGRVIEVSANHEGGSNV